MTTPKLHDQENDDLRPEYDLKTLKGGVRGKYFEKAKAGSNLVVIDPDLFQIFPDSESVNQALRLLATAGQRALVAESARKKS